MSECGRRPAAMAARRLSTVGWLPMKSWKVEGSGTLSDYLLRSCADGERLRVVRREGIGVPPSPFRALLADKPLKPRGLSVKILHRLW